MTRSLLPLPFLRSALFFFFFFFFFGFCWVTHGQLTRQCHLARDKKHRPRYGTDVPPTIGNRARYGFVPSSVRVKPRSDCGCQRWTVFRGCFYCCSLRQILSMTKERHSDGESSFLRNCHRGLKSMEIGAKEGQREMKEGRWSDRCWTAACLLLRMRCTTRKSCRKWQQTASN